MGGGGVDQFFANWGGCPVPPGNNCNINAAPYQKKKKKPKQNKLKQNKLKKKKKKLIVKSSKISAKQQDMLLIESKKVTHSRKSYDTCVHIFTVKLP